MSTKRTVTLEIAGSRYRIASDADEAHLEKLAQLVNERVEQLGLKGSRTAAPAQVLAVVALGLADDLVASMERAKAVESLTRDTVARVLDRIDRRLASDEPKRT